MGVHLDAHSKPPDRVRQIYKDFQRAKTSDIENHKDLLDPQADADHDQRIVSRTIALPPELSALFVQFLASPVSSLRVGNEDPGEERTQTVWEVPEIPALRNPVGLLIYPSLLPPEIQLCMLDRLLHRDVSNPQHRTNVHLFHNVVYPPCGADGNSLSFFDQSASETVFQPINVDVHKPFSITQFWNKKLRWATFGGQYDWTNKHYPEESPPPFPADLKALIDGIFPMKAEAAILNLYSPGDTLSLHRDVSEDCNQPLVSISIGCDAIFTVGLDSNDADVGAKVATIRLRSGDAVLLSEESRYAWHGVPKIIPGTCPEFLHDWPFLEGDSRFASWQGWMSTKRVNLNVRQMFDV